MHDTGSIGLHGTSSFQKNWPDLTMRGWIYAPIETARYSIVRSSRENKWWFQGDFKIISCNEGDEKRQKIILRSIIQVRWS